MTVQDQIDQALSGFMTKTAGRLRSQGDGQYEPAYRQRLDHYVGSCDSRDEDDEMYDAEGWDEDSWDAEYVCPLRSEIMKRLTDRGITARVEVGEKGHVYVEA